MKLAIVIPWFGRGLKGGAEQHAWELASRVAQRSHSVEVLTTCCQSHQQDWATNHLPPGAAAQPEGFTIRRFRVDPRDRAAFDTVCARLQQTPRSCLRQGVSPVDDTEADLFIDELIRSSALLEFLESNKNSYDRFIFLPYLYFSTLRGIPLVGKRAVLQPCLHDESYAYLPQVAEAFHSARSIFFLSQGEMELAARLFGPGIIHKSAMVGAGIETEPTQNGQNNVGAHSPLDLPSRFALYLGRKDKGKNVDLLLNAFRRFRRVRPNSELNLIFAGPGEVDRLGLGQSEHDLGLVRDLEKNELLERCAALLQPSTNESFSRVMMEAWLRGRPVAAHAQCLATAAAVRISQGGWIADQEEEWARLFVEIDRARPEELDELGRNGRRYAEKVSNWEEVIERFEEALQDRGQTARPDYSLGGAIHQILPNLAFGDAISNQALFIRDVLRQNGYDSNIYVKYIDPRVTDECEVFETGKISASASIIYHHSVGTELTPHVVAHLGPKLLIYHNITPSHFFLPYRPAFADILRQGQDELSALAPHFLYSAGDSSYNVEELKACGFRAPSVLPIAVDPSRWDLVPDRTLMAKLQDGRTNLLFVGRMAPNKRQYELIRAFSCYLKINPSARLLLPGFFESNDPYVSKVVDLIRSAGLNDSVIVLGSTTDAELAACYRTAHLFWSMSEHEGFGVPLIEAMWFDIPVMALKSSAVPETLGAAAFMFTTNETLPEIAGLAYLLTHDQKLRTKIVNAQRKERERFTRFNVRRSLEALIEAWPEHAANG